MPRSSAAISLATSPEDDDTLSEPAPTQRLEKSHLEAALAAMDDDAPRSVDENKRILMQAFRFEVDDEPTVDAPAPAVPAGTPSPLGSEGDFGDHPWSASAAGGAGPLVDTGIRVRTPAEAVLAIDLDLPRLSAPPPPPSPVRAPPIELLVAPAGSSGLHRPISSNAIAASAAALDRSRQERAAERRTRLFVIGIWATAVSLAAALAFVAATSDPPPIRGQIPAADARSALAD